MTDLKLAFSDLLNERIMQKIQELCAYNKILEKFNANKIDDLNTTELKSIWKEILGKKIFNYSVISIGHQTEIIGTILSDINKFIKRRSDVINLLKMKWRDMNSDVKNELLEGMASSSLNTTESEFGYRLQMGMRNTGCSYRKNDKWNRGCYMCGYNAGNTFCIKPTEKQLISQFENALKEAENKSTNKFDVIEFVNDGSFLNDEEVPVDVRIGIFKQIAEKLNIKRVLIESRPEYISEEKIIQLINILRENQKLEIGIGIESIDKFVSNFCINKGFGRNEFERIVELINRIEKNVGLLVYALVKPAYLTEKEAIEDSIKTGKYVKKINEKFSFKTIIKFEPAVVAEGTLLDVLYDEANDIGEKRYSPPSYWTIVEIISRMECEGAGQIIRIGAREDMDVFKAIPAVYYDIGMLSRYDFLIYDAVQKFNQHKNMPRFLSELEPAFSDISFQNWMEKHNIKNPTILHQKKKCKLKIEEIKKGRNYQRKNKFFKELFSTLDKIEYGREMQSFARQISKNGLNKNKRKIIQKRISQIITQNLMNTSTSVNNIDHLPHGLQLLRMELNINNTEISESFSIWIGIPTSRRVKIEEI